MSIFFSYQNFVEFSKGKIKRCYYFEMIKGLKKIICIIYYKIKLWLYIWKMIQVQVVILQWVIRIYVLFQGRKIQCYFKKLIKFIDV